MTRPRVVVDGDTARMTALVEAQHVLIESPAVHALLKNHYTVDLVRDDADGGWLIRRLRIDNAWITGDPVAIFGR